MTKYQELQKDVFNWLKSKYEEENTFTYSVRQKANKGAELNYFIGTERSKYFSTTFWFIPVAYPGSSGDLINLVFEKSNIHPSPGEFGKSFINLYFDILVYYCLYFITTS